MSTTSDLPYPSQPGNLAQGAGPKVPLVGGLLVSLAVLFGGALLGLAGGFAWAQLAPRATYEVVSRGSADVVNTETTAFIAGDAWYCLIGLIGGVIIGLAGYLLAVRRYGPVPMLAVLAGSVAAAYIARLIGQNWGLDQFDSQLLTSHQGTLLHAPLVLGGDTSTVLWPALASWPFAASLVAGGLVLFFALRAPEASPPGGPYPGAQWSGSPHGPFAPAGPTAPSDPFGPHGPRAPAGPFAPPGPGGPPDSASGPPGSTPAGWLSLGP